MDTLTILSQTPYVSLRTYRKNGTPLDAPVWCVAHNNSLYVFSAGDAGKVKRLRNSSKAQIAQCNMRGKISGPWHDTVTTITDGQTDIQSILKAFYKKYRWQMWVLDFCAKLTGKFPKRAYLRTKIKPTSWSHSVTYVWLDRKYISTGWFFSFCQEYWNRSVLWWEKYLESNCFDFSKNRVIELPLLFI